MTKTEAANFLEISEKTITRYVSAGRLPARYVKGKTGKQLDFDEADVQRLKDELETPVEIISEAGQDDTRQAETTALVPTCRAVSNLSQNTVSPQIVALAQLVQTVMDGQAKLGQDKPEVPVESRLVLSMDEATALSGVPRSILDVARKDGRLPARKLGRGFKVRREDVEKFVAAMWEEETKNK